MKGRKRQRASAKNESVWSAADHASRQDAKDEKLSNGEQALQPQDDGRPQKALSKQARQMKRRRVLTHETREKRDKMKLKLHIVRVKKEIDTLKRRLESWDAVEEKELLQKAKAAEEEAKKPKKKGRKGPETWKLRGAARPACEVYDFDVGYKDPYAAAHDAARNKAARSVNLLVQYRGKFATDAPPEGREYLSLLMQLGHLSHEARQFKTARECWLECLELEGDQQDPITTAREDLMRMYVDLGRTESALKLGKRFADDSSVWIRYSTALVALQNRAAGADQAVQEAIRSNVFCAYYLAYYETFSSTMEYTEEIGESDDPQSSFEEAVEYCSIQGDAWTKENHHLSLRHSIQSALRSMHDTLQPHDVAWEQRLDEILADWQTRKQAAADDDDDDDDNAEQSADLGMFIGMFRTAMDMTGVQREGGHNDN